VKKCTQCESLKLESEFYADKSRSGKIGLRAICKSCTNANNLQWARNNPGPRENHRLKSLFGITLQDYDKIYKLQKGVCKICKQSEKAKWRKLAVDHCHATGVIRGLLCFRCNTVLGKVEESPKIIKELLKYANVAKLKKQVRLKQLK
jgi:hypothetical protein